MLVPDWCQTGAGLVKKISIIKKCPNSYSVSFFFISIELLISIELHILLPSGESDIESLTILKAHN
jgi:hypothetical protein